MSSVRVNTRLGQIAGLEKNGVQQFRGIPYAMPLQGLGRIRAPEPMHGKISTIDHKARGLFHGVNGPIQATRYHSLIVARETLPEALTIEATTEDGQIMALSHRELPVHGVQFHPESIASEHGATILGNFLAIAERWPRQRDAARPFQPA